MHHLKSSLLAMHIIDRSKLTEHLKQIRHELCNVQQQPAQAVTVVDGDTAMCVP